MQSTLAETPDYSRWFVVKTQPRKEALADLHLKRQAFRTYFPKIMASPGRSGARPISPQPFFPGYVFVQLSVEQGRWRSINGTFGVSHLVQFGHRPATVPAGLVEHFIANTSHEGILGFEDQLKPGASVRVVGGAFDGHLGVLEHTDPAGRAQVLMEIMSRKVAVFLPQTALVAA